MGFAPCFSAISVIDRTAFCRSKYFVFLLVSYFVHMLLRNAL